ncbi:MAG: polysaccharide biosynthesis/export family protein [Gammaproteobacteria bacterium]|nr:polysaccharide biosynthesis/export family protein [Gammaproteobacteria bacterium]
MAAVFALVAVLAIATISIDRDTGSESLPIEPGERIGEPRMPVSPVVPPSVPPFTEADVERIRMRLLAAIADEFRESIDADIATMFSDSRGGTGSAPAGYRVAAGDVLSIDVTSAGSGDQRTPEPQLSTRAVVGRDGRVPLPLLGDLPVTGRTAGELEQDIEDRLAAYIRQPAVTIAVDPFDRNEPIDQRLFPR